MEPWMEAALAAASSEDPVPMTVIPDVVPGRILSLDGDYLAYFMAGNDDTDSGTARRNAVQRIDNMRMMTGSTSVVMHLSATGCTKADRFLIAETKPYQEKRAGSRKPKNWASLRDFFESYQGPKFAPKLWSDREADDGMAYMQQKWITEGKEDLIVTATRDKDMRQYSGWHMDWLSYQLTWVPPGSFEVLGDNGLLYGHKWFWQQCLQGDDADCIPGLPRYRPAPGRLVKIGEKTAEKVLAECKTDSEAFDVVLSLYVTFYEEFAAPIRLAEQMLLLWLRRDKSAQFTDMLTWLQLSAEQRALMISAIQFHQERVSRMKQEVLEIEALQRAT